MAVLPIYTYGSTVLRRKAKAINQISDETIKLIMDMFETMRKASGVGLAATQVGSLDRIVVLDVSSVEELKDVKPLAIINPEVVWKREVSASEEGCLSIPDVRDEVERPEEIKLRYKDTNFNDAEIELTGFPARVVLHEIDHLDGILFIDHLSPEKRKAHAERLEQIERGEIEVSYPVVTANGVTA